VRSEATVALRFLSSRTARCGGALAWLLAVNLLDMSGFDVCREIRSNPETTYATIVHMSASSMQTQHQVIGVDYAGAPGRTSAVSTSLKIRRFRMQSFLDGPLDYSLATVGKTESSAIDCDSLVDRVIENVDAAIPESGAQIVRDGLPVVLADTRIEYAFRNLRDNAIKYRRQPDRARSLP